jgi:hypothetical protein
MALANLDQAVGQAVGTLPNGTEYRQVLENPGEGQTHVTPDGRLWTAVHEELQGTEVVRTPFTLHWRGPVGNPGNQLDPRNLAAELSTRLAGRPSDGSRPLPGNPPFQVVWVDAGDEVLVHLESIACRMIGRNLLVSIDLETDQTGRTPLVVTFALSNGSDAGGLVGVTDDLPRGNGVLAARWGRILQNAIWAALLGIGQDFAAPQNAVPRALTIVNGILNIQAGPLLQAGSSTNRA